MRTLNETKGQIKVVGTEDIEILAPPDMPDAPVSMKGKSQPKYKNKYNVDIEKKKQDNMSRKSGSSEGSDSSDKGEKDQKDSNKEPLDQQGKKDSDDSKKIYKKVSEMKEKTVEDLKKNKLNETKKKDDLKGDLSDQTTKEKSAEARERNEAMRDAIKEAVKRGKEKIEGKKRGGEGSPGGPGERGAASEEGLLKTIGAEKVVPSLETVEDWKSKIRKLLMNAMGFDVKWKSNAPHPRLEGQLGRSVGVRKLRHIVISIDCSGSMGWPEFRYVLTELATFFKVGKFSGVTFHIVYWGGNITELKYVKTKKTNSLLSFIKTNAPSYGGTVMADSFVLLSKMVRKPDAIIVCTDGEISDRRSDSALQECQPYLRRKKSKIVWVLTQNGSKRLIKELFDPGIERRYVKQRKG